MIRVVLQTALVALVIGSTLAGREAAAAAVVVPNAQASAEGNTSSFGPFFDSSVRYQQIYALEMFPRSGPLTITRIVFRPDGSNGNPTLFIVGTTAHIELSTTNIGPESLVLNTTFANNVGADVRTVYDGPVTSAPVSGPAGGPKDFTIAIDIDPFVYDPSLGNLLLDVRATSSGVSAPFDALSEVPAKTVSHIDAPSSTATTGTFSRVGLVTKFEFTTEPKTVWSQEYAFAWANQPTAASYTPLSNWSYNYLGGPIQITRTGTGSYSVQFATFGALGIGGNVQVTAYGSFSGAGPYCKVASWGSDTVNVRCFNASGAAADEYFTVLYLKASSLPTAVAYAWANDATASNYSPSSLYAYNPTGSTITGTHANNPSGFYSMFWDGFGVVGPRRGHPHVTAYDVSNKRCQIGGFSGAVTTRCFAASGAEADSLYSVMYLDPEPTADGLAFAQADNSTAASYSPNFYASFNSGDGPITATRSGTGVYAITFTGFTGNGINGGNVQVSGYGGVDRRCSVSSWSSDTVSVRCHDAAGAPLDTTYQVLYLKPVVAPEPGRAALLAAGATLLGLLARRRRQPAREAVSSQ